jgi:transposase
MAMGKRLRDAKQRAMWVATQDLPRSAAHPFYTRLNQILDEHDFDEYVEGLCERFYADEGRPGLSPGRYFRLLLIGYFEGLDAERASGPRPKRLHILQTVQVLPVSGGKGVYRP